MNRLLEIGFQLAGHWHLEGDKIRLELLQHGTQQNVLYAFVSDGEVKYVGKTVQPLQRRLYGYQRPGTTQATNVRNHAMIKELLSGGAAVDVFALPDNGLLHYGQFHVNLAAGLEDSIVSELRPTWNGLPTTSTVEPEEPEDALEDVSLEGDMRESETFEIVLHPTYLHSGFFNVRKAQSLLLGNDGQNVEIFLGNAKTPVTAVINRRANKNQTPRILGGTTLRDWFRSSFTEKQRVKVSVYSPTSIRMHQ